MMQKKLLALAVAGAFAAPAIALAQSSNVEVGGRMNLSFDRFSATGATAGAAADVQSRNRLADSSSRLWFRGTEDLGNGLQAIFHIESGVNGDASAGAVAASTGALGTRQTFVGLKGKTWGEVRLGRQEVYWTNGKLDSVYLGIVSNNMINAMFAVQGISAVGATGNGVMGAAPARTDNVVTYITPNFSNFTGQVQYAVPIGESTVAGSGVKQSLVNLLLSYDNGPWYGQIGWVRNSDAALPYDGSVATTAAGNKIEAWRGGLAYTFPTNTMLSLMYEKVENHTGNGAGLAANVTNPDRDRHNTVFNIIHTMGNTRLIGTYGISSDVSGAAAGGAQTGAKHWGLAAAYSFSKRTNVYAAYTKIDNDANANYNYIAFNGNPGTNFTPVAALGADPTSFGVGLVHKF